MINIHRPALTINNINTVLCAGDLVGNMPTEIMLDTGSAVPIVRYKLLPEECCQRMTKSPRAVVANRIPLDVVGRTKVQVSLGSFSIEEEFTVICNLTVDCLLGEDIEGMWCCFGLSRWHSLNWERFMMPCFHVYGSAASGN